MRRATTSADDDVFGYQVSIHARLATGDDFQCKRGTFHKVSIHARLATGDFQATLNLFLSISFNSRPSCDGRHSRADPSSKLAVSIHARLATGDKTLILLVEIDAFQFTPVLRRATHPEDFSVWYLGVSIHARLATGDFKV